MSTVFAGIAPFDVNWLVAAVALTTPVLLAAIGELVSERSGVLNIGLEGMMLSGAFFGYYVAWLTHSTALGFFGGIAGGLGFGAIMAGLAINARADQIVIGVAINLAAAGLTGFLYDAIFSDLPQQILPTLHKVAIPLLSDIPGVGRVLFQQNLITYLTYALVPLTWLLLMRTKWGLVIRATGDLPPAAETAGASVIWTRWLCVLWASALAGLAGAYLSVAEVGAFQQGMTGGRGFLALAAVIFGRWRSWGVLIACLLLGAAEALQLRLADAQHAPAIVWAAVALVALACIVFWARRGARNWRRIATTSAVALVGLALFAIAPSISLPDQFWQVLPFLLALAVLSGTISTVRMPTQLTVPYRRGDL